MDSNSLSIFGGLCFLLGFGLAYWIKHDEVLKIKAAAAAIYYRDVWRPVHRMEEEVERKLWTNLRDACGFKPGASSHLWTS